MAEPDAARLPWQTQLAYGLGEMGTAIPISIAVFFLLYFLTTVAGLSPALAGGVLLVGRVWDAVNDPLIGWLSDRTRSPWGRRYPWIVLGSVPLGLGCTILWWVPPLNSQGALLLYYSLVSLLVYAAFTAVQLPFTALGAELAQTYDDRTRLMGVKSAFSIVGSVVGLLLVQGVFTWVSEPIRQYRILGLVTGIQVILTLGLSCLGTYGQYRRTAGQRLLSKQGHPLSNPLPLGQRLRYMSRSRALQCVIGLYLCAWIGLQLTAAMLPYFIETVLDLPEKHVTRMAMLVQGSALLALPVWVGVSQRTSKSWPYYLGAPLAAIALMGLGLLPVHQVFWLYGLGGVVGVGVATVYLVPFALLPDVIDLDTMQTGHRQEGLFFSVAVFLQKVGLALALFTTGHLLQWTGFVNQATHPADQPETVLWMIRLLTGPIPAISLLLGAWILTHYPISRKAHRLIQTHLQDHRPLP